MSSFHQTEIEIETIEIRDDYKQVESAKLFSIAIKENDLRKCKQILEDCPSVLDYDKRNNADFKHFNRSFLHKAIKYEALDVFMFLLEKQPELIHDQNVYGFYPIHAISFMSKVKNYKIDIIKRYKMLDSMLKIDNTILSLNKFYGKKNPILFSIIDFDIDDLSNPDEYLFIAKMFQLAIETHGADVNSTNDYGWTPLHYLAFQISFVYDHSDKKEELYRTLLLTLLDNGADVNALDNELETPIMKLDLSLDFSDPFVSLFIERGARLDIPNKFTRTMLERLQKEKYKRSRHLAECELTWGKKQFLCSFLI